MHAVAQGLDVPLGKDDPVTQLGHAIAGRGQCLVILDNFEQVARYAEETLGRWLNRAGDAQFVVTTREVLGLNGEEVLAVAPLHTSDAITLFMRRAGAAKPDFQPDAEDPSAITRLVELLDCLPLAIELAAARVRVMPPRTLLSRMGERFKLLRRPGRATDARRRCARCLTGPGTCCRCPRRSRWLNFGVRGRIHARVRGGGAGSVRMRRTRR